MSLIVVSFIAGALTVAAPCILPLLPIVVGGSSVATNSEKPKRRQWVRPVVIVISLSMSVVLFTLLLKATTALLGIPTTVWQYISGGIVILLGLVYLFPQTWSGVSSSSIIRRFNRYIASAHDQDNYTGAAITGAALGPVFNSCSPTYLLIAAVVLPASFTEGLTYLISYAMGLGLSLLVIALVGQKLIAKLGWLDNIWFKRTVGILFIIVGIAVIFGLDRDFQEFVLDQGWYAPISELEISLRQ